MCIPPGQDRSALALGGMRYPGWKKLLPRCEKTKNTVEFSKMGVHLSKVRQTMLVAADPRRSPADASSVRAHYPC